MNIAVAIWKTIWPDATLYGSEEGSISHVCTDSRQVLFPSSTIFFALPGAQHDGHQFLDQLRKEGVRFFVVSNQTVIQTDDGCQYLLVTHVLKAFHQLAYWYRHQFSYPVIGITGSNGKTTVKEWLFQLLCDKFRIVRNPGSFNSQLGVPLSLIQMDQRHNLGIFEAGISQKGEMAQLGLMMDCQIGLFLNLGAAHDEGFASREEKLLEKYQLFANSEAIVYRDNMTILDAIVRRDRKKAIVWGNASSKTDLYFTITELKELEGGRTLIRGECEGVFHHFELPFQQEIFIENALHCIVTMLYLGLDGEYIQERLGHLKPLPLRLELLAGIHNSLIINDAYSNDTESLRAALEFMAQHAGERRRILVLSDFKQANQNVETTRLILRNLIERYNIQDFYGLGSIWKTFSSEKHISCRIHAFEDLESLEKALFVENLFQSIILIKGARIYRLERLAEKLTAMRHKTRLEINLGRLAQNIRNYRLSLHSDTKIMLMLKAAAYGSGDLEMVSFFEQQPVDYVAVAFVDEGIRLRQSGLQLPIMVLNPDGSDPEWLAKNRLEPEIFSLEQLHNFSRGLENTAMSLGVHIKLDTGMHRLGFEAGDLDTLISYLKNMPNLRVLSIFTHLVAAEKPEKDNITRLQLDRFSAMYNKLEAGMGYTPWRHVLNSSGISRFPDAQMDMVRLGIGMYGLGKAPGNSNLHPLRAVHTLKAVISQIKDVKAGETVGYGGDLVLNQDRKIATITIGYADGLMRRAGNGGHSVWLHNHLAPTIGSVCMDMTMIDVTDIQNAKVGDEVEIFGEHQPVEHLARTCDTISYEILSRIASRVKRVYVADW
jgi:Alr-MurF fusion protein